jgi:hypothetical protein
LSFTTLELILVISIISILLFSYSYKPFKIDPLFKAGNSLVYHIRYTQYLALLDDKFIANTNFSQFKDKIVKKYDTKYWFNKHWQIVFHRDRSKIRKYRLYYYSVFYDIPWKTKNNNFDRRVNYPSKNYQTIATDPQTGLRMTGHNWSNKILNYSPKMNLEKSYGVYIDAKELRNACNLTENTSPRILFDYMGRPYCFMTKHTQSTNRFKYLLRNKIKIYLFLKENEQKRVSLEISPYTGFVKLTKEY